MRSALSRIHQVVTSNRLAQSRFVAAGAAVAAFALASSLVAAPTKGPAAAERPKRDPPATAPAAPAADDGSHVKLAGGQVDFVPPEKWTEKKDARNETRAIFVSSHPPAIMMVEVQKPDADFDAKMAPQMIKTIRELHAKAKAKIVMEPKVEKDERYILRIHDKYEQEGKTIDAVRVYRKVGERILMVLVNVYAESADDVKSLQAAGDDVATSAAYHKPEKAEKPTGKGR